MSGDREAVRRRWLTVIVAALVVAAVALVLVTGPLKSDATSSSTPKTLAAPVAPTQGDTAPATTAPPPATGSYRGPVAILMYHVIKAPSASTPLAALWTPPQTFKATVELLKSKGYSGVTLGQVWKAWHGGPGLPKKPVVVSFDDGYLSHYVSALPILRAVGWPGVLNLEGKNIGPGDLTIRQVKALIAAGWEIGSHTLNHPDLTTVDDATLRTELVDSRKLLQEKFSIPVDFFCYPSGMNDARVRAAVAAAGYKAATTVAPGIASKSDDPYALPRIRVNGTDSAATIVQRLRSGDGVAGGY